MRYLPGEGACGCRNPGLHKAFVVFVIALVVLLLYTIPSLTPRALSFSFSSNVPPDKDKTEVAKNSAPNTGSVDYPRPNHTGAPVILYWQHYFGGSWRNAWPMPGPGPGSAQPKFFWCNSTKL